MLCGIKTDLFFLLIQRKKKLKIGKPLHQQIRAHQNPLLAPFALSGFALRQNAICLFPAIKPSADDSVLYKRRVGGESSGRYRVNVVPCLTPRYLLHSSDSMLADSHVIAHPRNEGVQYLFFLL